MSAARSVADVSGAESVWRTLADAALASGSHARGVVGGCVVVAVADLKVAELAANGQPVPVETPRLVRDDGRCVYFFAEPNPRRGAEL